MDTLAMQVRFLGLPQPKPWQMGERSGTSYKVQLAYLSSDGETTHFDAKISEEIYGKFARAGFEFGDRIGLELAPKIVTYDGRSILSVDVVGLFRSDS